MIGFLMEKDSRVGLKTDGHRRLLTRGLLGEEKDLLVLKRTARSAL